MGNNNSLQKFIMKNLNNLKRILAQRINGD
jgi:hypothetical protein